MIYGSTRYDSIGYANMDVVANEAYDDVSGTYALLEDNARNEQEIFNTVIAMDIQEAAYMNGLISESSMEVVTEGAIGSFFEKIKAFIKKVWEKIKGIFTHFMAKLNSYFMKDGKAFVNKYRKIVASKDFSKFKYKFRLLTDWAPEYTKANQFTIKITNKALDEVGKALNVTKKGKSFPVNHVKTRDRLDNDYSDINNPQNNAKDGDMISGTVEFKNTEMDSTIKKYIDDMDMFKNEFYKEIGLDGADDTTLANDMEDAMFEDEDELEGPSHLPTIISDIETGKSIKKKAEDIYKTIEKEEKKLINLIDNRRKTLSSDMKANSNALANANACNTIISAQQSITSRINGLYLSNLKKHLARCRAVFVKMVAFNPKSVKESAVLEEAAYEAGLYDAESSLFGY